MRNSGLQFFKHTPRFNRMLILTALERNPRISQSALAQEAGLTPSMVNNYIRGLSQQRLITIQGNTNRTISYHLTRKGLKEKMSLLVAYILETTGLYQSAKQEFMERLKKIYDEGMNSAVLFGAGETAELLVNACKSLDLQIIGVVDNDPEKQGTRFGNLIIQRPECIERMHPDVVIIASIGRQDEIYAQIRHLAEKGISIRTISFSNGDSNAHHGRSSSEQASGVGTRN